MSKTRLNLYIDEDLVRDARAAGLNILAFVEQRLSERSRSTSQRRWLEENRDAIRAYNEWVARDGPILQDLSLL